MKRRKQPSACEDELRAKAAERTANPAYRDPAKRQFWLDEFIRVRRECFGIVSLSAVPDNKLMWSHYASAHTGFCVGLDSQKIMDVPAPLEMVEYVDDYPDWDYLDPKMVDSGARDEFIRQTQARSPLARRTRPRSDAEAPYPLLSVRSHPS